MSSTFGTKRPAAASYLFLSALTGILELGPVLWAARSGWPIGAVTGVGLVYQLACLFVHPFSLSPRLRRLLLVAGLASGVLATTSSLAILPATLLVAIGLQGVRDEQLAGVTVSTLAKRCARIVGFGAAAAFSPWFLIAIPAVVMTVAAVRPFPESAHCGAKRLRLGAHTLLMVTHQIHYFAYSYVLLFVLVQLFAPGTWAAAGVFALGWISYSSAQSLLSRLPILPVVVTGHLLVTAMLIVIAMSVDAGLRVAPAWIVGGLGGGTVYCIKLLGSRAPNPPDDIESWENIGHVLGSGLAVASVMILPVSSAFVVAAGCAATTAVLAITIERRARQHR